MYENYAVNIVNYEDKVENYHCAKGWKIDKCLSCSMIIMIQCKFSFSQLIPIQDVKHLWLTFISTSVTHVWCSPHRPPTLCPNVKPREKKCCNTSFFNVFPCRCWIKSEW